MKISMNFIATCTLLISMENFSFAVDNWRNYEFDEGISLSSPVEITRTETENGVVYIGIDASGLPDPRFTLYSLAIVPLTDEQRRLEPNNAIEKATESAWSNKFNRDLRIQSSEPTVWRSQESVLTLAKSRFVALPYTQYHVDRSFIHDGVRYSLSASQLMQNTNSIAMSEFGLIPSDAELRKEERRIRTAAERFFSSFTSKNLKLDGKTLKGKSNKVVDSAVRQD